jgi:hypothetical protein
MPTVAMLLGLLAAVALVRMMVTPLPVTRAWDPTLKVPPSTT